MPGVDPDLNRLAGREFDDIDLNLERYTRLVLGDVLADEFALRETKSAGNPRCAAISCGAREYDKDLE